MAGLLTIACIELETGGSGRRRFDRDGGGKSIAWRNRFARVEAVGKIVARLEDLAADGFFESIRERNRDLPRVVSKRQPVTSHSGDSGWPSMRYTGLIALLTAGIVASVLRD